MRRSLTRLIRWMLGVGLLTGSLAVAQTPVPIPITGNLGTISGSPQAYAGVLIQLQNCPSPVVITGYSNIVQTTYQIRANASGVINSTIWPNNLINCNGTTGNSQYSEVAVVNGVPSGTVQCYQVSSSQGIWNLNTQQPISCSSSPPNPQDGQYNNLNITGCFSIDGGPCFESGGLYVSLFDVAAQTMEGPLNTPLTNGVYNAASCGYASPPSWCSGTEMGAWINSAIADMSGGCGEIYIPRGTYSATTTISRPSCVDINGAGSFNTTITWTGTSGYAVIEGSTPNTFDWGSGGWHHIRLLGPQGTTGATSGGMSGMLLGCSPTGIGAPICPSSGPIPQLVNTTNIDLQIQGFNYGIEEGSSTWLWHCIGCKIIYNWEGVHVGTGLSNSGEVMTFDASSISNNTSYAFDILSPNSPVGNEWFVSHSSIDYNNQNGTGTQIFGSLGLAYSHIEQFSGYIFDTSGFSAGFIRDTGSSFVLTQGPTGSNKCFGNLTSGSASSFVGSIFYSTAATTDISCGTGQITLEGVVYENQAFSPKGSNYTTMPFISAISARIPGGTNLNTVTQCGYYDGQNLVNAPTFFGTGFVHIQNICNNDSQFLMQFAYDMAGGTNRSFVRHSLTGSWSSWAEMMMPDNSGNQGFGGNTVLPATLTGVHGALETKLQLSDGTGSSGSFSIFNTDGALTNGPATSSVPSIGTPTVGQAACIKAAGPPVVIGFCSTVVGSGGACSCN